MYDWTIDEFPSLPAYAVQNLIGCGCVRHVGKQSLRNTRSWRKPMANRQRRRVVHQMLKTGERVKMPRAFTCWDII